MQTKLIAINQWTPEMARCKSGRLGALRKEPAINELGWADRMKREWQYFKAGITTSLPTYQNMERKQAKVLWNNSIGGY
jgi:hypothetical protein